MTSPTTCSFSLYFLSVFLKWKPHTVDGNQKSGINSAATGWSFLVVPPVFPMILHKVLAPSKRWLVGNGISTLQPRKVGAHQPPTGADADPPTAPHYISSANNNQLTVGETQILQICGRELGWSGDDPNDVKLQFLGDWKLWYMILGNNYLHLNWWVDPGFLVAINIFQHQTLISRACCFTEVGWTFPGSDGGVPVTAWWGAR